MGNVVDTEAVVRQAQRVSDTQKKLNFARDKLEGVRRLCGQTGYSITIGGYSLEVAQMDKYYNPQLIRGREMLHLGALKALAGEIRYYEQLVASEQSKLAALTALSPENTTNG